MKGWATALGGTPELDAKYTEPKALIGAYNSLEKLISAKGIIKPGANATPAEMDAYYAQLGRPAKVEDYGIAKPDKITVDGKDIAVPPEVWDAAAVKDASALFHKIGLTKEQAAALVQFDVLRGVNGKAKFDGLMETGRSSAEAALKAEWGSSYAANLKLANDAALQAGWTREQLQANPHITNDPTFIKSMAAVGKMIVEPATAGARGGTPAMSNPAAKIAEIHADKNHPWHPQNANKNPGAHKAAVQEMANLYKAKHGEA